MAAGEYVSSLPVAEKKRYMEKIQRFSLKDFCKEVDPYELEGWKNDISLWPPVEFGCIYSYLIETPGEYTKESLKAYKSLSAYNYYYSGWVQTVFYRDIESNKTTCLLKANVMPSQRLNIQPHTAWVAVKKKSGDIITGHCTCTAGCGEVCSHVAAILFKVEACIRLEIGKQSCTSLPCTWNQVSKNVQPATICTIDMRTPQAKRKQETNVTSTTQRRSTSQHDHTSPHLSQTQILDSLYSVYPSSAIFTVVPGYQIKTSAVEPNEPSPSEDESEELPLSPPTAASSAQPPCAFPSTSNRPSTSTSNHPSTSTSNHPSTSTSNHPSTSTSNHPSTSTSNHPSTSTSNHPSTSTSNHPSTLHCEGCDLPPLLSNLYDPQKSVLSESEIKEACKDIFVTISVTDVQVYNLYRHTKRQADSEEWFQHRLGRITSSNVHSVLKFTGRSFPNSIINTIMQYNVPSPHIPSLKWGREHEDQARRDFAAIMEKSHENFKTVLSGLVINTKYPYMAASPDGISKCSCCGKRILEIKCPFKYREEVPTSPALLSRADYCLKSINGKAMLSRKHSYYSQIQLQLLLTEEKVCDFVCWTTRGIFMEEITPDPTFKSNIPKLKDFFVTYVLPELVTHNFKERRHSEPESDDEKSYCFCGEDKPGMMIGCDNPSCEHKWFHYSCVSVKRKPRGKWFCPNCR